MCCCDRSTGLREAALLVAQLGLLLELLDLARAQLPVDPRFLALDAVLLEQQRLGFLGGHEVADEDHDLVLLGREVLLGLGVHVLEVLQHGQVQADAAQPAQQHGGLLQRGLAPEPRLALPLLFGDRRLRVLGLAARAAHAAARGRARALVEVEHEAVRVAGRVLEQRIGGTRGAGRSRARGREAGAADAARPSELRAGVVGLRADRAAAPVAGGAGRGEARLVRDHLGAPAAVNRGHNVGAIVCHRWISRW